jgi:hypothetical protein
VEDVAEKLGGLVIEIVPGDKHIIAEIKGEPVQEITLHDTAQGTVGFSESPERFLEGHSHEFFEGENMHSGAMFLTERSYTGLRPSGKIIESQVYMNRSGLVSHFEQGMPEPHAVLSTGDSDKETVTACEHFEMVDDTIDLAMDMQYEVFIAVGGVMGAYLDESTLSAGGTFHEMRILSLSHKIVENVKNSLTFILSQKRVFQHPR